MLEYIKYKNAKPILSSLQYIQFYFHTYMYK